MHIMYSDDSPTPDYHLLLPSLPSNLFPHPCQPFSQSHIFQLLLCGPFSLIRAIYLAMRLELSTGTW